MIRLSKFKEITYSLPPEISDLIKDYSNYTITLDLVEKYKFYKRYFTTPRSINTNSQ